MSKRACCTNLSTSQVCAAKEFLMPPESRTNRPTGVTHVRQNGWAWTLCPVWLLAPPSNIGSRTQRGQLGTDVRNRNVGQGANMRSILWDSQVEHNSRSVTSRPSLSYLRSMQTNASRQDGSKPPRRTRVVVSVNSACEYSGQINLSRIKCFQAGHW
jgi:hypothetical protein